MKIKADKISSTQQIEKDYKVKLKRINYEGWLIYEIYDLNGKELDGVEWLLTLKDVEKRLKLIKADMVEE